MECHRTFPALRFLIFSSFFLASVFLAKTTNLSLASTRWARWFLMMRFRASITRGGPPARRTRPVLMRTILVSERCRWWWWWWIAIDFFSRFLQLVFSRAVSAGRVSGSPGGSGTGGKKGAKFKIGIRKRVTFWKEVQTEWFFLLWDRCSLNCYMVMGEKGWQMCHFCQIAFLWQIVLDRWNVRGLVCWAKIQSGQANPPTTTLNWKPRVQ